MKTKFLIPALLVMGMSATPLLSSDANAQVQETQRQETQMGQQEDKVQIDPMQLPEPVKETIQSNTEVADLDISEAWQVMKEDGTPYFKVSFDNAGEEVVKKYDAEGKEIDKDDKDYKDDNK